MQSTKRTPKAKVGSAGAAAESPATQEHEAATFPPSADASPTLIPPAASLWSKSVAPCGEPDIAHIPESWGTYSRRQRRPPTKMENEVSYPLEMCSYFHADEIKRLGKRFENFVLDNSGSLSVQEFMSLPELQQKTLVQWLYRYIRHRPEWRRRLQRINWRRLSVQCQRP